GAAALRTFTLRKIPAAAGASIDQVAARLSREVVLRWTGDGSACADGSLRNTGQLVQGGATLVGQLQLQLEGLASNAREFIEGQFGGDPQAFIDSLLDETSSLDEIIRTVDRIFAPPKDQEAGAFVLQRPLGAIVSPLTMKLTGDLSRWVLQKLDDRQERLTGAQGAAGWLVDHLTGLESDASRLAQALGKQIAAAAEQRSRGTHAAARLSENDRQQAAVYFRMRTDQQAVVASAQIARRLLAELKLVSTTVAEFGRHLKHLALSLPQPDGASANDSLARAAQEQLPALADAIDEHVQKEYITPSGGLFQTIMGNSRVRAQMLAELTRQARRVAEQLATRPEVVQSAFVGNDLIASGGASDSDEKNYVALPKLLAHGGAYRGLAVLPQQAAGATSQVAAVALGPNVSVLGGIGSDIVLCQEAWDLPLVPTAADLIQGRRDYAEFAARVVTRSDVPWTPLTAPPVAAFPTFGDNASSESALVVTHVL
nr:hypothetical protein [Pirellulales bacterium]